MSAKCFRPFVPILVLFILILSASPSFAQLIPKTNWTLVPGGVDSEELVGEDGRATNGFDGNTSTFWHTEWLTSNPPPPHEIQINLGNVYSVGGFRYLPRQDGLTDGWVGQFAFYVSSDGVNWGTAVATGTFANNASEKEILFSPKSGQFVRLRALSEVNGRPWTSMAELNVLGSLSSSPTITNLNPTSGPVATAVTITGTNFGATQGTSTVRFNGTTATPTNWSNTSITAPVPAGGTTGNVVVTVGGLASNGVNFTVQGSPANLIPKTNWTLVPGGVDSQELVGEDGRATNSFDGNTSTFWHTEWLTSNPPPPHEIQINLGNVYSVGGFRYLPRQDGLTDGWVGQFAFYVSSDGVNWGTAVATGTFANNASEKEILFSPKSGQFVRLRALSEVNGRPWTSMAELNVLGSLSSSPTITSIVPNSGPTAGGQTGVVITGTNLSGATSVTFGGTAATITGNTSTTITVTTPAHAAGAVNVVATVAAGSVTSTNGYTYLSSPTITSIVPNSGPTAGGQTGVVITGTNLSGATSVTFGGTAATITGNTSTTITVTTPAHAAGAVNVVATVSAGSVTSTNGYTYLFSPTITNLNPTSGPVATAVTITGTNFGATQGTSTVRFNGTTATPTNWSNTSITAPVPAGGTTGNVVVTVGGLASNGVNFTVQGSSGNLIPKTNWTLKLVDSQELVAEDGRAINSFDGNPMTIWHTQYSPSATPLPHEIQINLGAVYNVSGFRYLPRQDGYTTGRIGQYEFYLSLDGTNWGNPAATGTFANTLLEKEVLFPPRTGQFVRLVARSEVNGTSITSMGELGVLQTGTGTNQAPDGQITSPVGDTTIVVGSSINFTGNGMDPDNNMPLSYRWSFGAGSGIPDTAVKDPGWVQFNNPGTFIVTFTVGDALGLVDPTPSTRTITVQSGSNGVPIPKPWTLQSVDSQEVVGENGAAINAFDGNANTIWHTQWFNISPNPPPPHEIRINLGAVYDIGGFRYLPRQDGLTDGWVGQFAFYVSLDGVNWGSPVVTGSFTKDSLEKEVSFIPRPGQYVRFRALSEIDGRPWTSMAELNVLQAACITPSVNLIQPLSYYLQTTADLHIVADACLTSGQGVRMMIDGGSAAGGAEVDDYDWPFEVIFTGLTNSEHVVDAFVIDAGGTPVAGIATYDQAIQVGIGDYYVAMGDSITVGGGDIVHTDDSSQDGRNTFGGYTPILDDSLTAAKGRPHNVANEGVSGARSAAGVSLIPSLLEKHPEAQRFLIMYGTNDAGGFPLVPSGLGLQPGNAGYPGSFKDNMQRIINAINGAGKLAILAKGPVALPLAGQRNTMIQEYNQVIDQLFADLTNNIQTAPPDFHAYFETHYTTEYFDEIHPNGIGYQSISNLWINVLIP